MKLDLLLCIMVLQLTACVKLLPQKQGYDCLPYVKITANNTTPTVGDEVVITANTGPVVYTWSGPDNFVLPNKADGTAYIRFGEIKLRQRGWYYCQASVPGCNAVRDSIFIDVKYKQGTPPCTLTNNVITGTGVPDLQNATARKSFSTSWNCVSLYASGTFGNATYTFNFNSYNGNVEPKDGIYVTTDLPTFDRFGDENMIYLMCQYSNYYFVCQPNQNVYVSHVNGKLRIAFCNLKYNGNNGNSVSVTSTFSGQVTEQ